MCVCVQVKLHVIFSTNCQQEIEEKKSLRYPLSVFNRNSTLKSTERAGSLSFVSKSVFGLWSDNYEWASFLSFASAYLGYGLVVTSALPFSRSLSCARSLVLALSLALSHWLTKAGKKFFAKEDEQQGPYVSCMGLLGGNYEWAL